VDQLIPTTEDHTATSLDVPDSDHVAYEQEEEGEGMQPLPARPTRKDTSTALSVLDTVISASDADEKIVKAMDDIQDFVSLPTRKDTSTALSVLDTVISASDADEKIVKAMDDIQDFVSKIYRQSLKQRSIDSYFKKQLPNIKF
jgi:hypothetical protein